MRIFFGTQNFKIKDIYPHEIGLSNNIGYTIEIRQKYFHIYWIPFFGTGKIWGIRKDGELYELPVEYIREIKRRNIKVRSPWYTYSIPLLVCFGFFAYYLSEKIKEHNYEKQNIENFSQNVVKLTKDIDDPATNQFYTLQDTKDNSSDAIMYLKVEKIYHDKIMFSLIPGFFLNSSQLELDECYNDNKGNLDTISISKALLKKALNLDYEATKDYSYKGQDLLGSKKLYAITSIERKFEPKINITQTYIDYKVIQIELTNSSSAFKILSIKNISNSIPWNAKLPMEISAGTESKPTKFTLENTENSKFSFYGNNKYSAEIKILDSNNIEYTYLISGTGTMNSIEKT
ncbi:hypothetical protein [Flavobacterium sp. KACC 22761]|uniref:hypothetical protein n=1 Tax=Flavobacterium sp. KACC 22761 TaxID=3092665 RepID=UPI002A75DCD9|nr:hypothetical protein [Flavobacterium sp. KACC 22761]WPO79007.1 hypothetical protein SCB73_01170 [Flavobacterium sp. KACC 22761]